MRYNHIRVTMLPWTAIVAIYSLIFWTAFSSVALASPANGSTALNVKAFGVRGDGHSDDTGAIERLLATRVGNSIYFPAGNYAITRPVDLPSASIRIYGDGRESVIRETSENLGVFNLLPGSTDIEIDHLHFAETGTVHGHQLGRGAIYINPGGKPPAVSNIFIHDNFFDCASTSCIAATYLVNSRIQRNTFDNDQTGEHGVYLSSDSERYSHDVLISENIFHSSYHGKLGQGAIELAIQLRATKRVSIVGNRILGWSDGILTIPEVKRIGSEPGVSDLVIRDNTIDSPADDAFINFSGMLREAIVEGNNFISCGENGIRSDAPLEQSIFERNTIVNSGEAGIRLNFVSHSIFVANAIHDSGRLRHDGIDSTAGIRLNQGNADNLLVGNTSNNRSKNDSGPQTFGLSVAEGPSGAPNVRNCVQDNRFLSNSRAETDQSRVAPDCTDMLLPIDVEVISAKSRSSAGLPELRVTNRNRVPLRIVGFKARGTVGLRNQNCGDILEAHGQCTVNLARPSQERDQAAQLSILYGLSGRTRTATVTVPLNRPGA